MKRKIAPGASVHINRGLSLPPRPSRGANVELASILPNVLLVGGQKSGTSALAEWLFRARGLCRPRIFSGEPAHFAKEAHFFDRRDRYEEGTNFWAARFEHCRVRDAKAEGDGGTNTSRNLVMDATPNYLPFAERVREAYDRIGLDLAEKLKVLVVLRDPVKRELSLYNHKVGLYRSADTEQEPFWRDAVDWAEVEGGGRSANGKGNGDGTLLSFEEYSERTTLRRYERRNEGKVQNNKPSCYMPNYSRMGCYGFYALHLMYWMKHFRHDQILILSHAELLRDTGSFVSRIDSFLGLQAAGRQQRRGEGERGDTALLNVGTDGPIPMVNVREHEYKVEMMRCSTRDRLERVFESPNRELYRLLASKDGPEMEQRPFSNFTLPNCTNR